MPITNELFLGVCILGMLILLLGLVMLHKANMRALIACGVIGSLCLLPLEHVTHPQKDTLHYVRSSDGAVHLMLGKYLDFPFDHTDIISVRSPFIIEANVSTRRNAEEITVSATAYVTIADPEKFARILEVNAASPASTRAASTLNWIMSTNLKTHPRDFEKCSESASHCNNVVVPELENRLGEILTFWFNRWGLVYTLNFERPRISLFCS